LGGCAWRGGSGRPHIPDLQQLAFDLEASPHKLGDLVRHTGKLPQRKRERAV